jgi:hypothetical protein
MRRFVEGIDRRQATLFPECLADWIDARHGSVGQRQSSPALRRKDARRDRLSVPGYPRPFAMSHPWRAQPWRAPRPAEWQLHRWLLHLPSHQRAPLGARSRAWSQRISSMADNTSIGPHLSQRKPLRVGLRRLNANVEKPYPPAGDAKEWWSRLKAALGTQSSDFVDQTLFQLQTAARLPCGGISEVAVNAALALIESAKPENEIEAALIIQIACTHTAAMAVLSRIGGAHGGDRHVAMMAAAASKLLRAYAIQVETLRRLRSGGSQYMRIEHIHIEPDAQAVIGNFKTTNKENE